MVLAGSSVTLGDVAALDGSASTVSSRVSDAVFTSEDGLGSFNGGVYTAGTRAARTPSPSNLPPWASPAPPRSTWSPPCPT